MIPVIVNYGYVKGWPIFVKWLSIIGPPCLSLFPLTSISPVDAF